MVEQRGERNRFTDNVTQTVQAASLDVLRIEHLGNTSPLIADITAARILPQRIQSTPVEDADGQKRPFGDIISTSLDDLEHTIATELHSQEASHAKIGETLNALAGQIPVESNALYSKADIQRSFWSHIVTTAARRTKQRTAEESAARDTSRVGEWDHDRDQKLENAKKVGDYKRDTGNVIADVATIAAGRLDGITISSPRSRDLQPEMWNDLNEPHVTYTPSIELHGLDGVAVRADALYKRHDKPEQQLICDLVHIATGEKQLDTDEKKRALGGLVHTVRAKLAIHMEKTQMSDRHAAREGYGRNSDDLEWLVEEENGNYGGDTASQRLSNALKDMADTLAPYTFRLSPELVETNKELARAA